MKPLTGKDLIEIELRARQLRSETMRDTGRAIRGWIAARFGNVRVTPAKTQHG